jgi:hypothetical protein
VSISHDPLYLEARDMGLRQIVASPIVYSWIAPCCKRQRPMMGRRRVQGRDGHPTWICGACRDERAAAKARRAAEACES